jgi:hypothetical protein
MTESRSIGRSKTWAPPIAIAACSKCAGIRIRIASVKLQPTRRCACRTSSSAGFDGSWREK